MPRYLILHGHFYQPPRANPWLGQPEKVDTRSGRSIQGFNDLVDLQCYTPNSLAYLFEGERIRLVNNFAHMSFNIGPTLMEWLQQANFGTYQRIIQADFESQAARGGHGNALAQVFNHVILPLAPRRDKQTQIAWGKAAFAKDFGRAPEAMWLAEAAIDAETVACLIEAGMSFVVASPRAAGRVRPLAGGVWQTVTPDRLDTSRPYLVRLPEGELPIFFFDPFYYDHVGGMLKDARRFFASLHERYPDRGRDSLVTICTDGELYGHWEAHGERFLAYVLTAGAAEHGLRVTNFGHYLATHPPQDEVELTPQSSWSCPHGVERWRSNCGCSDEKPGQQHFRAPLRAALDQLGEDLYAVYRQQTDHYFRDPLQARHDLLSIRADDAASEIAFLDRHLKDEVKPISLGVRRALMNLLESQRYSQMMFTSCAWFFWDVNRPEPLQNLQCAAQAIERLQSTDLIERVEGPFLQRLERAQANQPPGVTARELYLRDARYTALKYQTELEEVAYPGGVLLKVPFELRGDASERLQWHLRALAARDVRELTLDLGAVDYLDNYAVSALIAIIPVLQNRGGRLRIYRARDNIREIVASARLSGMLDFIDTAFIGAG